MVKTEGNVKYLWQFDRLANVAEVFRLPSKKHVNTVDLTASGVSNDPTPDLGALAPHGTRIYIALRGPLPQTGAHAAEGLTPGLGVVELSQGGMHGTLAHLLATAFINPINDTQESDPHAAFVRRK